MEYGQTLLLWYIMEFNCARANLRLCRFSYYKPITGTYVDCTISYQTDIINRHSAPPLADATMPAF